MILPDFSAKKVLIIGDVMLDRYVYGDVKRISPEAPVPIFDIEKTEEMAGGAANVAANIAALGAQAHLISAVGLDEAATTLRRCLANRLVSYTMQECARGTTVKTRYIARNAHVLRVDDGISTGIWATLEDTLIEAAVSRIPSVDIVIISDYGKGVLTKDVLSRVLSMARASGKPIIVNPKGHDFTRYCGATAIVANVAEIAQALQLSFAGVMSSLNAAALMTMARVECPAVLITLGEGGMFVSDTEGTTRLDAQATHVADVSGAGDTVVAAFALGVAAGLDYSYSAHVANMAAAIVVEKKGTAQCQVKELSARLLR